MSDKHIIFDLDGTLIDSKGEIVKTYEIVFNEIPPKIFPALENLNFGQTINTLLKGVYGDEIDKIKKAKLLFASIYDCSDYEETHLYEGVYETLNLLKKEGCQLYIATNKRHFPTTRILELKKISHLFSYVVANEMTPGVTLTKREMIATLKSMASFTKGYMVGDSSTDIEAGNEELLSTIAVVYGYESRDILALKNPTFIIDRFQNLSTFVLKRLTDEI